MTRDQILTYGELTNTVLLIAAENEELKETLIEYKMYARQLEVELERLTGKERKSRVEMADA